jgi:cytidylate kinase
MRSRAGGHPTVVAIDGPAAAGKSTVAEGLARRLGLRRLDTGSMYRAVALAAVRDGTDPGDERALTALARSSAIEVGRRVVLDGQDVTERIRSPEVTEVVSEVSAHPGVRREMVRRQREWLQEHGGGVVEGRDTTTVVFPDADLKVYLTASEEERLRRRARELGTPDHRVVEAYVTGRDHLDSTRASSPLAVAEDAVVIDTTGRSVEDVVDELVGRL